LVNDDFPALTPGRRVGVDLAPVRARTATTKEDPHGCQGRNESAVQALAKELRLTNWRSRDA
jgi:hypothetical protein